MIVDSHLHLWQADVEYPNPAVTAVSPVSDIPLELLEQYMAEHGIDRAVIVQPLYPGEDNSYIAECAATNPDRFAAVCVIDPRRSDAAARLEYWVQERNCRGLRLRPIVADEAECFGQPTTFPIWEFAQQANVVISILGEYANLPTVRDLALRYSQVRIVVDHLAHPPNVVPESMWRLAVFVRVPERLYESKRTRLLRRTISSPRVRPTGARHLRSIRITKNDLGERLPARAPADGLRPLTTLVGASLRLSQRSRSWTDPGRQRSSLYWDDNV